MGIFAVYMHRFVNAEENNKKESNMPEAVPSVMAQKKQEPKKDISTNNTENQALKTQNKEKRTPT